MMMLMTTTIMMTTILLKNQKMKITMQMTMKMTNLYLPSTLDQGGIEPGAARGRRGGIMF
jgi:hypothetical protein